MWLTVLSRSQTTGPFQTHAPRIHGKEMFSLVRSCVCAVLPVVEALSRFGRARCTCSAACCSRLPRQGTSPPLLPEHVTDGAPRSSSTLQDDPHVDEHNAKVLFKVTEGFHTFSRICAFYDLHAIFNKCIICLCTVLSRSLEEVCGARARASPRGR